MLWDCATIHHGFLLFVKQYQDAGFYWTDTEGGFTLYRRRARRREHTRAHTHPNAHTHTHTSYLTIYHSAADTAVALHNTAARRLSITQWFDFFLFSPHAQRGQRRFIKAASCQGNILRSSPSQDDPGGQAAALGIRSDRRLSEEEPRSGQL